MTTYKTFKEVKKEYTVEKSWHTPWHFSASGQYVCYLSDNKECYKDLYNNYIVADRR